MSSTTESSSGNTESKKLTTEKPKCACTKCSCCLVVSSKGDLCSFCKDYHQVNINYTC